MFSLFLLNWHNDLVLSREQKKKAIKKLLKIVFIDDCEEVRSLNRERVLKFLTHECLATVVPYLEHIIYKWNEDAPKFHEALGEHYIAKVKQLLRDYINVLREALYEERALLLGRMKRHQQALAIYTQILKNYKLAEKYCTNYFDPQDPEHSKVFLILLQMYTSPPDISIVGLMQNELYQAAPNPAEAIRILKEHSDVFDTVEAVASLPLDYTLKCVWPGVATILQAIHDRKVATMLHRCACDAALKRLLWRRAKSHSVKFVVDYTSECAACGKRVANRSALRTVVPFAMLDDWLY
ncbi:unnamed protein product [Gongylonema pulchrum]|uniref:Vps39_2 domain-containing protein n=1 Tax=Gongylonema pulchrum TaxID=637853 RepID=A0A183DNG0_9BILA|nr:unnamed protein product [Gongylonema pulchrum]